MTETKPRCPAFDDEPIGLPHTWEQVTTLYDDRHGNIDLVRCTHCLTYLEVVRPNGADQRPVVDVDKQESDEPSTLGNSVGPEAFPGMRVVYAFPGNGYPGDVELAERYLARGADYTVETVDVGSWRTTLTFGEVPGVPFNSVLFEELI